MQVLQRVFSFAPKSSYNLYCKSLIILFPGIMKVERHNIYCGNDLPSKLRGKYGFCLSGLKKEQTNRPLANLLPIMMIKCQINKHF